MSPLAPSPPRRSSQTGPCSPRPLPRGPRGKPTPALLRSVGDPPDGTRMTAEQYAARTLEFHAELVGGRLDYLPMPDDLHARIVRHLNWILENHLRARHPGAAAAGQDIRVRLPSGRSREPDRVVLLDGADPRRGPAFWTGADLCVEVVSPDDPDRDYLAKRRDYAAAGVREYWIVDPRDRTPEDPRGRTVRVLTLENGAYRETIYEEGETAPSPLLPGLTIDVTPCLAGA